MKNTSPVILINIANTHYFLDQTEKDMERTAEEIRHKQTQMKQLTKDFDKIFTKKYQLEKMLLENLENQAANDTVVTLSIT